MELGPLYNKDYYRAWKLRQSQPLLPGYTWDFQDVHLFIKHWYVKEKSGKRFLGYVGEAIMYIQHTNHSDLTFLEILSVQKIIWAKALTGGIKVHILTRVQDINTSFVHPTLLTKLNECTPTVQNTYPF